MLTLTSYLQFVLNRPAEGAKGFEQTTCPNMPSVLTYLFSKNKLLKVLKRALNVEVFFDNTVGNQIKDVWTE
jgi:hypothetical protein